MTRFSAWDGIPVGTLVTLRRGALSGEKAECTKAWTASGPMVSPSGVAVIRVDIGGAVVTYPLERVSLGWTEPPVTLAAALDPPRVADAPMGAVDWLAVTGAIYFVSLGLAHFLAWVLR